MSAGGHDVVWAGPRPLWASPQALGVAPAILRFADDHFMDELHGLLDRDPGLIAERIARPETWRTPQGGSVAPDLADRVPLPAPLRQARRRTSLLRRAASPVPADTPLDQRLKLYQPVHQRHYVACATLACRRPGFPDRRPDGPHEQLGYVIRRVMPDANGSPVEHAFVRGGEQGAAWQPLAGDRASLLGAGEERLGVFPLRHADAADLRRTLWGAVIPVGRREEYLSAAVTRNATSLFDAQMEALSAPAPQTRANSVQARIAELKLDFSEPCKAMLQSCLKQVADISKDLGDGSSPARRQARVRAANFAFQTQSWLLVSDLRQFLARHLPDVLAAVDAQAPGSLEGRKRDLWTWLTRELTPGDVAALSAGFAPLPPGSPSHLPSLAAALRRLGDADEAQCLEDAETAYRADPAERAQWPEFHFLLAGIASDGNGGDVAASGALTLLALLDPAGATEGEIADALVGAASPADEATDPTGQARTRFAQVDRLVALVGRSLDTGNESAARPLLFAHKLAQTMVQTAADPGRFVIRFVHLNADCGPKHPPTLSAPSALFEMASFFDPDAPARPLRITLPADTSPAGLRKHARGTAFVLSNMLCGQVQRAKGLGFIDLVRQVLPWPLHKDIDVGDGGGCKNAAGLDIGMICSISIPIITLCALILLMIIVSLLDFIFRWLPWFVVCFPVPGLKGKKAGGSA